MEADGFDARSSNKKLVSAITFLNELVDGEFTRRDRVEQKRLDPGCESRMDFQLGQKKVSPQFLVESALTTGKKCCAPVASKG